MKNYIIKHDFGYGKGDKTINKLQLRNVEELNLYIDEVLNCNFNQLDKTIINISDN